MNTSVIIPNWNGEKLIENNFPSWVGMDADEIVIVDDGSKDNSKLKIQKSIRQLADKIKNFRLIENDKNLGFARSVNIGVKTACGDVVILLNTDVRPLPGLLKEVLPHFNDSKVFAVSFNETQWSWGRGLWKDGFVEHEPGYPSKKTHTSFWVSGGSGAFRKSIWDELGGFDVIFAPFYWEDIDISYRAAKRGYKNLWEPKARVEHRHEGTINKYFSKSYISFIQERNRLIFIWKNITSEDMFKEHLKGLARRFLKNPGYSKLILAALSKWSSIIKARRREKGEEIVGDEEIFKQFS